MSCYTFDSYIFPRATPLEVEQYVKNNLGEVEGKKVLGICKKDGDETNKSSSVRQKGSSQQAQTTPHRPHITQDTHQLIPTQ